MSDKEIKINIYNEVGGKAAVSDSDGQKIFEKINAALKAENIVVLDFINIDILISAFLNTAIGQLYRETYDADYINNNLKVINLKSNEYLTLVESALHRGQEYYRNPQYKQRLEEAIKEEFGNG